MKPNRKIFSRPFYFFSLKSVMKIAKTIFFFMFGLLLLKEISWEMKSAAAFEPLSTKEAGLLKQQLIPAPRSVELGSGMIPLDEKLVVTIELSEESEKQDLTARISDLFQNWFGKKPNIKIAMNSKEFKNSVKGAYFLEVDAIKLHEGSLQNKFLVRAADFEGVLNALKTIRQLAEPIAGTKTITGWTVVPVRISDEPSMQFRGLHLCWFPETRSTRIEQAVRMAAFYKFNYLVLEFWGVYPFKALPEFCYAEHATDAKEIRRLVKLGKDLGLTMIPQFNMFGHASAARGSAGKHCLLDFHPEFAPLFEPSGWCWCLSNPETRKVLVGMIEELLDVFENPPYIHLGCDEADNADTCPLCRKADYKKLLIDHFRYFGDLVKKRGARPMIWHDMLIRNADPRWKGYVVNGPIWADDVLKNLSHDYIICDWQYSAPKKDEKWPTQRYFKDQKFDVIACPWENAQGIASLGNFVKSEKTFGLLCTTWHHFTGSKMRMMLISGSEACWGGTSVRRSEFDVFPRHLRLINHDAGFKHYIDFGMTDMQLDNITRP